jgi:muconolactone delta-isomerase
LYSSNANRDLSEDSAMSNRKYSAISVSHLDREDDVSELSLFEVKNPNKLHESLVVLPNRKYSSNTPKFKGSK